MLSFRHTKQTSKNVAGTTFNNIHQWNNFLITYLSFLISQNFTKRSYSFCFLEDQILFCYFWFMIFSPTFQLFKKLMIFLLFILTEFLKGFVILLFELLLYSFQSPSPYLFGCIFNCDTPKFTCKRLWLPILSSQHLHVQI